MLSDAERSFLERCTKAAMAEDGGDSDDENDSGLLATGRGMGLIERPASVQSVKMDDRKTSFCTESQ